MNYSCEEEYNEGMSAKREAEMMAEQHEELQEELESLEMQKMEIDKEINKIRKLLIIYNNI